MFLSFVRPSDLFVQSFLSSVQVGYVRLMAAQTVGHGQQVCLHTRASLALTSAGVPLHRLLKRSKGQQICQTKSDVRKRRRTKKNWR